MKKANVAYEISVYDKDGNVIKTCMALEKKIRFGTVRKIMALLNMDDIDDSAALMKAVYGAYDQVTAILSECFPDMTDEDWDNVYVEDLIPVIVGIAKASLNKIIGVPSDSKN